MSQAETLWDALRQMLPASVREVQLSIQLEGNLSEEDVAQFVSAMQNGGWPRPMVSVARYIPDAGLPADAPQTYPSPTITVRRALGT